MRALAALLFLVALAEANDGYYVSVLRERGIERDATGIGAFLRTQHPTERAQRIARTVAEWLEDPTSGRRSKALQRLLEHPTAALVVLKRASRSRDPEVRRSVAPLIESVQRRIPREPLLAALHVVRSKRLPGLVDAVLGVVPICFDPAALRAAEAALRATTTDAAESRLRRAAVSGGADERVLALRLYGARYDAGLALAALKDPDGHLRLAGALALCDRERSDGIPVLVGLLDSGAHAVRSRAAHALRHISGEAHGFDAHAPPDVRRAAAARWHAWASRHALEARWSHPLPLAPADFGRTLIAINSENRVLELDVLGRERWSIELPGPPLACISTGDGSRIISYYLHPRCVTAVDRFGDQLWQSPDAGAGITNVHPLDNGNLLLSFGFKGRIAEFQPPDAQVWTLELNGSPCDARPLPGGRLLVALFKAGRVVEMDRRGKVSWALPGLRGPYSAQRLPDGNTLVCEMYANRVAEYTRDGTQVWKRDNLPTCYSAQRLPSGRTLIGCWKGVVSIGLDDESTWLVSGQNYHWVHRY